VYGDLVPLERVLLLRQLLPMYNALWSKYDPPPSYGADLRNSFLAAHLGCELLGVWSLGAATLDFLEIQVQIRGPLTVLEFGSGISTVCLARYMLELHGSVDARVFSLEQDNNYARQTRQLLGKLHLEGLARVIEVPVIEQVIEGKKTRCYDLDAANFTRAFGDRHPDFILIDGPMSRTGSRYGVVPLIRNMVGSGAHFFLDDALRDSELEVGRRWSGLPHVEVRGIRLLGHGILEGRILMETE
jgi:hypothetical protein